MAKLRFLLDQPHEFAALGCIVSPDELVEVTDATYATHAWSSTVWDVVDAPRTIFDPAQHTVVEVNAYLAKADDEERARVLAAEREGQARKGILDNAEGV